MNTVPLTGFSVVEVRVEPVDLIVVDDSVTGLTLMVVVAESVAFGAAVDDVNAVAFATVVFVEATVVLVVLLIVVFVDDLTVVFVDDLTVVFVVAFFVVAAAPKAGIDDVTFPAASTTVIDSPTLIRANRLERTPAALEADGRERRSPSVMHVTLLKVTRRNGEPRSSTPQRPP